MGGACDTYGEEETCIQRSGEETLGKPPPNLAVDGRIIFRSILDRSGGRWAGLIWLGIGTSSGLLTSRETIGFSGLCSMQLSLLAYIVLQTWGRWMTWNMLWGRTKMKDT
jgi:hypothetical protein